MFNGATSLSHCCTKILRIETNHGVTFFLLSEDPKTSLLSRLINFKVVESMGDKGYYY